MKQPKQPPRNQGQESFLEFLYWSTNFDMPRGMWPRDLIGAYELIESVLNKTFVPDPVRTADKEERIRAIEMYHS